MQHALEPDGRGGVWIEQGAIVRGGKAGREGAGRRLTHGPPLVTRLQ